MGLWSSLGLFVAGVVVLVLGGDLLVRGAVVLAERRGVRPLTIGLTIVAFGTSAPELAINVAAALSGDTALSFGNMVGSSLSNTGLILGLAALLRPMKVHSSLLKRELPVMLGTVAALITFALLPGELAGGRPGLTRFEGLLLLGGFGLFLRSVLRSASRPAEVGRELAGEVRDVVQSEPMVSTQLALAMVLGGLTLLGFGGKLGETGAVGAATALGLSQHIIGLTVVSVATTLPELLTSILAIRRGQSDLALGNIVGSNIFNTLFVLGLVAVIATVPLPEGGLMALAALLAFTVLLFPMSISFDWTLTRPEGGLLLLLYVCFIGFQLWLGLTRVGL